MSNHVQYLAKVMPPTGYFLEIGAWQGEHYSQSYYLEQQGWKGLCVDPFVYNFHRRSSQVCHKAISADGKPRIFIKVSNDRRCGGDVSYFSGFKDSIKDHKYLIETHCSYEEIEIETITIDELYLKYSLPYYIDFLSIDTEGSELEILSSIDFKKYSYGMIMFEHNGNEVTKKVIGKLLKTNGYQLFKSLDIDDVFINNKIWNPI